MTSAFPPSTPRTPFLDVEAESQSFSPRHQRRRQVGLDLQFTASAWLWTLEAAGVEIGSERFAAALGGLEFTFFDLDGFGRDLGPIAEDLFDDRDAVKAPATPVNNDALLGGRLTWSDVSDTELLAGAIVDLDHGATQMSAEVQSRIGDANLLKMEMREAVGRSDPLLAPFEDDANLLLPCTRFL